MKTEDVEVSRASDGSSDLPREDVATMTPWTVVPRGEPTLEQRIAKIEKWIDYHQQLWNKEAAEAEERLKSERRYCSPLRSVS